MVTKQRLLISARAIKETLNRAEATNVESTNATSELFKVLLDERLNVNMSPTEGNEALSLVLAALNQQQAAAESLAAAHKELARIAGNMGLPEATTNLGPAKFENAAPKLVNG